MKFPTTLLSVFRNHAGSQDPADAVLEVPRILAPHIEIPETNVQLVTGTLSPDLMLTSFGLQTDFESAFGGASVDEGCFILGPGIWDILISASYISNFTSYNETAGLYLLRFGTTDSVNMLEFGAVTGCQIQQFKLRLAHDRPEGYEVRLFLEIPPAAGNKHSLESNAFCNRLG